MEDVVSGSCTVIYSMYDALALSRVVGVAHCTTSDSTHTIYHHSPFIAMEQTAMWTDMVCWLGLAGGKYVCVCVMVIVCDGDCVC